MASGGAGGSRIAQAGSMHERFSDRRQAGRQLADVLSHLKGKRPVVLALPPNGVPVAYEIARRLDAPLELFIVRKVGMPNCPQLAMGALASGGIQVLDGDLIRELRIWPDTVDAVIRDEMRALSRRELRYGVGCAPPVLRARTVILVDDGLAAGLTMRAAVRAARQQHPTRIIVAVPVAAREAVARLDLEADEVVTLQTPEPFGALDAWYDRFDDTTAAEVRDLLDDQNGPERIAG
jgi:predicted phosphoribosyltransferase